MDLKDPYLYTAVAPGYHGKTVDEIRCRFGVRTFHVDPEKRIFLKWPQLSLRGVSRHQDWKGLGNAITKEHHQRTWSSSVRLGQYGPPRPLSARSVFLRSNCDGVRPGGLGGNPLYFRTYGQWKSEHHKPDEGTDCPELQPSLYRLLGSLQRDYHLHQE